MRYGRVLPSSSCILDVLLAVENDGRLWGEGHAHEVPAQGRVTRCSRLGSGTPRSHEQAQRLGRRREIEFRGDDLEEARDAGLRIPEELGAGVRLWGEVNPGSLASDLEDQHGGVVVDKGPRVVDPTGDSIVRVAGDANAALLDALEAEGDLGALAGLVEGYAVGDESLLEALEVEVAGVAEELCAVVLVADGDGVAPEETEDLCKGVGAAVGDGAGDDGGWADESIAVEAGEEVVGAGEESGEAEGEEVGGVARVGEEVAGDLEFAVADGDEYALLVEAGDELGD